MLRSMTGYGKAEGAVGSRKYTVEVRSLNGKNLDLSVRMPSVLKEKEMELRKQLGARIVRGKSDVAIHFEADAAEARHELNGPVITSAPILAQSITCMVWRTEAAKIWVENS